MSTPSSPTDETAREIREIEFRLAHVDADIAVSSYSARRVASLRRQKAADQDRLAALAAEQTR